VLLASRRAVNEAQQVLAHLTGVEMSASAWFREPRPQGARAQAVRQKPDAQAATVVPLTQREKGNLARQTVAREGPVSGALDRRDNRMRSGARKGWGVGRWRRPARSISASASARGSLGVRPGAKRYCVWTPSGAMSADVCSSRTPGLPTSSKTELRRVATAHFTF
jgi:hypothetical protein